MTSGWGGDTRPLVLRGEKEAESETKRIAHETNTREKIGATTRMGQGAEGATTITQSGWLCCNSSRNTGRYDNCSSNSFSSHPASSRRASILSPCLQTTLPHRGIISFLYSFPLSSTALVLLLCFASPPPPLFHSTR